MSKTYVVTVEGNKTIVRDQKGNIGTARCNPEDKFDVVEGFKTAIAKMVLSNKTNPFEALLETLLSERYAQVTLAQ